MFERYTERARQVVVLAQEAARGYKHTYIGTEHLLLALIREEEGLAARALEALGASEEKVVGALEPHMEAAGDAHEYDLPDGEQRVTGQQIPFTPRCKRALENALREALSLGHNYIGTEHILLALVRDGGGLASVVLDALDAGPDLVRNEVYRLQRPPAQQQEEVTLVALRLDEQQAAALFRLHIDRALEGCQFEHGRMRWWLVGGLLLEHLGGEWWLSVVPSRRAA